MKKEQIEKKYAKKLQEIKIELEKEYAKKLQEKEIELEAEFIMKHKELEERGLRISKMDEAQSVAAGFVYYFMICGCLGLLCLVIGLTIKAFGG